MNERTRSDASLEPSFRCLVCGGDAFDPRPNVETLPLWRCRSCGLLFQWPQPSDDRIAALYQRDYYKAWNLEDSEESVRRMKRLTFRRLIRRSGLKPPGRLLDVGCATGYFLEASELEGFDSCGVEINEWAAGIARERFGTERVHLGAPETAPWPQESFDGVFMSDFIEHVRQPEETLRRTFDWLRPGGALVVVTPNVESLSCKIMKGAWPGFKLEHLCCFSPKSLSAILRRVGFEPPILRTNRKAIMPEYARSIFERYPRPLLTPLLRALWPLLRIRKESVVFLPLGDMECIARKPD